MRKQIKHTPAERCALALLGEPQGSDYNAPPPRPIFMLADTGMHYQPGTPPFTVTPLDKILSALMERCDYIADGERGYLRYRARLNGRGITPFSTSEIRTLRPLLSPPYAYGFDRLSSNSYRIALPLPVNEDAIDTPSDAIRTAIADWNALHPESIPSRIEHVAQTPYLIMTPPHFQTLYDHWAEAATRRIIHAESRVPASPELSSTDKPPPDIGMALRTLFASDEAQDNATITMSCLPKSIPPLERAQAYVKAYYSKEAADTLPPVHRAWESAIRQESECQMPLQAMYRLCQSLRNARSAKPNVLTTPGAHPYGELIERCRERHFTILWSLRGSIAHMEPVIARLNTHFNLNAPFRLELRETANAGECRVLMTPESLSQLNTAWNTQPRHATGPIANHGTIVTFPTPGIERN